MCGASNPVVVKVCMPPPLPPPPSPMQEKICKLDALRLLLRPFVGPNCHQNHSYFGL